MRDVQSGKQVSCEKMKQCVQRHINDVKRSKSKAYPYTFDPSYADKYISFIKLIKLVEGDKVAGRPWQPLDWQAFVIAMIWGWRHKTDKKYRRFTDVYLQVAKKNTKTTTGAGLCTAQFLLDPEPAAQVYYVSPSRAQSNIPFDLSKAFMRQLLYDYPAALDPMGIRIQRPSIVRDDNLSVMMALSKQANNMEGKHGSTVLADEWHVHPYNNEIMNNIQSGMAGRSNPLILKITTAGSSIGGPCHQWYDVIAEVLAGRIELEHVFGAVFEIDDGDDWQDISLLIKANPNIGLSPRVEFLEQQLQKAQNLGGYAEVDFITKHCNRWVASSETWVSDEVIRDCFDKDMSLPESGTVGYAGLDLAQTQDLSAFVIKFVTGQVVTFIFAPQSKLEDKRDLVDYKRWHEQGHVIEAGIESTDVDVIYKYIATACKKWSIQAMYYDPWSVTPLVMRLEDKKIVKCYKVGQMYATMSAPTEYLEKLLLDRAIVFSCPVLRWMFGNVKIKYKDDHKLATKESRNKKIDGVVALILAVAAEMTIRPKKSLMEKYGYA